MNNIGNIIGSDGSLLLKMWRVDVPPGKRESIKHSHIQFEIMLAEKGSGIYTVNNEDYQISKGDIFIFSSNETHFITNVGTNGLSIINLHFEPKYLWGNSIDSLSEEGINICFSHNKTFENRIKEKDNEDLRELFLKIMDELSNNQPEYQLTVKSFLNLFLVKLIRNFDYAEKSQILNRHKLHIIRRAIKYIDNNLCEKISLSTLGEVVGMSPNYFCTLFHNISGITIWDYINTKRIDKAIYLLHTKDMNILDIALECGFNNTANFNKVFKNQTGTTPSEYRNSVDVLY